MAGTSWVRKWFARGRRARVAPARRRPSVELLEDRRTPATAALVSNLNLVPSALGSNPANFVSVGNSVFFSAGDPVHGTELWKSDGTTTGTVFVKDVNVGSGSSSPSDLTPVGNRLFFAADDGANGRELWASDGTTAGTVLIRDVNPGPNGSNPRELTAVGNILYFTADGPSGAELWSTDGTTAGTVQIQDIRVGTGDSDPRELTAVNTTLFFTADDGVNGRELWARPTSPATLQGTVTLNSAVVTGLGATGNLAVGMAVNGPGIPAGTTIASINSATQITLSRVVGSVTNTVSLTFALAQSGTTAVGSTTVSGLASTSNLAVGMTVSGTGIPAGARVASINAATQQITLSAPATAAGTPTLTFGLTGTLTAASPVVSGLASTSNLEVGMTVSGPGIPAGATIATINSATQISLSVPATAGGAVPLSFGADATITTGSADIDTVVQFSGNSAVGLTVSGPGIPAGATITAVNSPQITISSVITTAIVPLSFGGSFMVRDIRAGAIGSAPTQLTAVGNTLFFVAEDGATGREVWQSNGTSAGTTLVRDIRASGSSYPQDLTDVNGTLYFSADDGISGRELWRTTGLVKDLHIGTAGSSPRELTNVNGLLFFSANSGDSGYELWRSDGTSAGTILVQEIRAGGGSSYPRELTALNGALYFSADDALHGYELWRSDGTATGTVLVQDIESGPGGSNPRQLTALNGTLFFRADDGTHGYELWTSDGASLLSDINSGAAPSNPTNLTDFAGKVVFAADGGSGTELWQTDGTPAGTSLIRDINGTGNSNPADLAAGLILTVVGGVPLTTETLFFTANDGANGRELWKSDGTSAGTVLVRDINADPTAPGPRYLAIVNGAIYFAADDGVNGTELWKSDGTAAGTVLVADIKPGVGASSPRDLTNINGTLYFTADDGTNGRELWKSDGTAAGTVLVKDIRVGLPGSLPHELTGFNGKLYFVANNGTNGDELWSSDGTAAGTVLVSDVRAGATGSVPTDLTVAQVLLTINNTPQLVSRLFFAADDGTTGSELWMSDGTGTGTTRIRDIFAGATGSNPQNLTADNLGLYFTANDNTNGVELWRTDGTTNGTVLVRNIAAGASNANPRYLTNVNGTLFFAADDLSTGVELWKSNGTATSTVLVKNIRSAGGSSPTNLKVFDDIVLFTADDGVTGRELWAADLHTAMLKDVSAGDAGSSIAETTASGNHLFFAADDGQSGSELWITDGTAAGTAQVRDIHSGAAGSALQELTDVGGTLFFTADNGTIGPELWKSDGSAAGTVLVKDVRPGSAGASPRELTAVGNTLFFAADDGSTGPELWKSNGITAGTIRVKDIRPGGIGSYLRDLTAFGSNLFFVADDGSTGPELWMSDGSTAGTVLVKDINPGSGSAIRELTVVGNALFFVADDGVHGPELWMTDGTAIGTVLVKDINAGPATSFPRYLTKVNGALFFAASDGSNGFELWKSDGTAAGTVMVKDINPGIGDSTPRSLGAFNGKLFFAADDGTRGFELWQSDGTAAGTTLFVDIRPGSAGSNPDNLVSLLGKLYFTANDGVNGTEVWGSDGTAQGTVLETQVVAGSGDGSIAGFTVFGTQFYFAATSATSGRELWFVEGDQAPVANRANLAVSEDTATAGTLTGSDPDAADSFTFEMVTSPTNGAITAFDAVTGKFTYRPATNYFGPDAFTFRLRDNHGMPGAPAQINITVAEVNDVPQAFSDTFFTAEETAVTGNVLANDTDPDNNDASPTNDDTVTAVLVNGPAHAASFSFAPDGSFTYTPGSDFAGNDSFTYRAVDSRGGQSLVTSVFLQSAAVNDPPTVIAPATTFAAPDTPLTISGISVNDPDDGDDNTLGNLVVSVHLAVSHGTLTLPSTAGLTGVSGNGTATVVFQGSLTNTNAALSALSYRGTTGFIGDDVLAIDVDDQGNSGAGGVLSTSASVAISVRPVNDPPVNSVPGIQVLDEEGSLVFSAGNTNPITVSDPDDAETAPTGDLVVQLTLSVLHGTLTLGNTLGLTITNGTGLADTSVTFFGMIADLNAALDGLSYTPDLNFNGTDTLTLVTDDQGNTGAGGPQSTMSTVDLAVRPVNDLPVNTVPATNAATNEETAVVFVGSAGNAPLSVADPDDADDGTIGNEEVAITLASADGTLTLAGVTGLTFTDGDGTGDETMSFIGMISDVNIALNGLIFTPAANFAGTASFSLSTSDQGYVGSGGALTVVDFVTIDVAGFNDAPFFTAPPSESTDEDIALVFSSADGNAIRVGDPDDADDGNTGDEIVQISLTVSHGTLSLATTFGLASVSGDGGTTVVIVGTLDDLNAALDGLLYTPDANYNGPDALTLTADDQGNSGTGSALGGSGSIALTVNALNDAPSFLIGPDVNLLDNAPPQFLPGWARSILPYPASPSPASDEANQQVAFLVSNNNNALFSVQPTVAADGTLRFTPSGVRGIATVSVALQDDGGVVNGGQNTSAVQTFTIAIRVATTLNLGLPASATFGVLVPLTATVSFTGGSGGQLQGQMVNFFDGTTLLGSTPFDAGGVAHLDVPSLNAGSHSITAVYAGDLQFGGSTTLARTLTVTPTNTTVTLTSSGSPSAAGRPVTLEATVTPDSGPPLTGARVSFFAGARLLGTALVNAAGIATLAPTFAAGTYAVTAYYPGDANHRSDTSDPVGQAVYRVTTTVLTVPRAPVAEGSLVTLSARVIPTGAPVGRLIRQTVTFYDGGTPLGTVRLNAAGIAIFRTRDLAFGDHSMTASFDGGPGFLASDSVARTLSVINPSTVSLFSSGPSLRGNPVTFTATVTGPVADVPTGTVAFYVNGVFRGRGTLVDGAATFTLSTLPTGISTIRAIYSGDDLFVGSMAAVFQRVLPRRG